VSDGDGNGGGDGDGDDDDDDDDVAEKVRQAVCGVDQRLVRRQHPAKRAAGRHRQARPQAKSVCSLSLNARDDVTHGNEPAANVAVVDGRGQIPVQAEHREYGVDGVLPLERQDLWAPYVGCIDEVSHLQRIPSPSQHQRPRSSGSCSLWRGHHAMVWKQEGEATWQR
jgi:hypothetical protein